jgi:type IV secretory pathway TraG/TraD family ATPase VirD4
MPSLRYGQLACGDQLNRAAASISDGPPSTGLQVMLPGKKSYSLLLAIALSLTAILAKAEIPRETLERLADIEVELRELYHLRDTGKITVTDRTARRIALNKEEKAIWKAYRQAPRDEINSAKTTIAGLAKAKLTLLEPQWEKEEVEYRQTVKENRKKGGIELEEDARHAAEFQRQRILLQQQLDQGAIDLDSFTLKDRAALDAIAVLRKPYEDPSRSYIENAQRFDLRMEQITKTIADNPTADLPRSQVPAAEAGQNEPSDFDSDVKLAVDLLVKQTETRFMFDTKQISADISRETRLVYDSDLRRIRERYESVSSQREQEFVRAYTDLAEPQLQALRVKYYPDRYKPPAPAPSPPSAGRVQIPAAASTGGESPLFTYAVVLGLIILFLWWLLTRERAAPDVPPLTDNYGTANWAAHQEKPSTDKSIFLGVMFGKSSHPNISSNAPGAPIVSVPEAHTLIVARTRAGKGTRVIVPTLLRYLGSMLVIDPKGENAAITARTRRDQLHQKIHIVNLWGEMKDLYDRLGFPPASFNPLDAIERDDLNAVAVAQTLAATICPVGADKDKFWQGNAANVLAAVFLWLADQPGEQKTLARAREIVTMSRANFSTILVKMMASTAFHGAIKEMVSQYIDLADETYSGIMSNLAENTKFLSDPRIKAVTNTSSVDLHTLRDVLTTVYIVIPHDRIQTHATWLRLVIAAAMQAIKGRSNTLTAPPHHRCMFLIDEFGSIGHIADIPRDIALMSGYGLDFTLIVQGLDQLNDHYGDAKGTILSNCGYKWFCYINELDTAKYLSESLGKATVRTVGKSKSFGVAGGGGSTEGESTTYGETGRSLLTPDEILNLGRDVAILLHPFGLPYYLRPVDYWKLPETFTHLKAEYAHFYWDPPLQSDPNPYAPQADSSKRNQGSAHPPRRNRMIEADAREILEVSANATRDEIINAYKRLIGKVHPDRGGSNYFAKQLNEAKAVLLGE